MDGRIDEIISESIDRFLIREYYGRPNGFDALADQLSDEIRVRWQDNEKGEYTPFTIDCNGLPLGYLLIRPTNLNVRAAYAVPPSYLNKPCELLINPNNFLGDESDGRTIHATLVHELTHMFEDIGRRRTDIEGFGGEIERTGHMRAFNNVIKNGVLKDDNKDEHSAVERAVARVIYYGVGFERNARNAAMFTKLMDLPAGTIKSYKDAINFLRSTVEYQHYERSVACAWYLVNLTDENDKAEALSYVSNYSYYHFKNWNDFRKWLKGFIRRYENKMNTVIPKMINYVINKGNNIAVGTK